MDPAPHRLHRRRRGEIRVRDHRRIRDVHVRDPLLLEDRLRRVPEVEVPDDVAGDEQAHLACEQASGRRRILGGRRLRERVGETAQAARTQGEHLDQVIVLGMERPRRIERLRLVGLLLLRRGEALDTRLQVRLLDAGRCERGVQLPAELRRVPADDPHLVHVVRVRGVLAARGTTPEQEDQDDHGEDQERDQAGEPQHRDEPLRRAHPGTRRRAAPHGPPRRAHPLRRFFGFRLVEEVELDVALALGHANPAEAGVTLSRNPAGKGLVRCPANPSRTRGERRCSLSSGRTCPRAVPPPPAARDRRDGIRLAGSGRAERARRRPEDRRAGGQGGRACGAGGRGGRPS